MNLTKRDVADLALVVLALSFLMKSVYFFLGNCSTLLVSGAKIGKYLGLCDLFAMMACAGGLLLLRPFLLDRLFPDAGQKGVSLPEEAVRLTDYAFWIRLLGLYSLLSSGIRLVSVAAGQFNMRHDYLGPAYQFWNPMLVPLVAAFLSLLVIWQAAVLARVVRALGSCGQPPAVAK